VVPDDTDVGICYVELVLPSQNKRMVFRVIFVESDEEDAQLFLEFIRQQVEHSFFMVVDDLLDV